MHCKLFFYLLVFENAISIIDASPIIGENVRKVATRDKFPFIASLQMRVPYNHMGDKHFCTGSLISARDVLTAAHCIEDLQPGVFQVVLGIIDLESNYSRYDVSWMVTYDQWANFFQLRRNFELDDVAILRLSTFVSQTNVKPAILSQLPTQHLYKTRAVIIGWGVPTRGGRVAQLLKEANVTIYTPLDCERHVYLIINRRISFELNQICTIANPFALVSLGDSGGPLLDEKNNLVGITYGSRANDTFRWGNFSEQFMNKYELNIHFSVEFYRTFIDSVTNQH